MSEDQVYEGGAKVSRLDLDDRAERPAVESPRHQRADEELIHRTVGRAVHAFDAVKRELAAARGRPFEGEEPPA